VGAEVTVLFRAVSIILVVMTHTQFGLVVSATSILFVISGLNFSRFLRPAIRNAGDMRPTANFIRRLKQIHSLFLPAGTFWQRRASGCVITRAAWLNSKRFNAVLRLMALGWTAQLTRTFKPTFVNTGLRLANWPEPSRKARGSPRFRSCRPNGLISRFRIDCW